MIYIIAIHECKHRFLSPLAWVILAVLQFIFAYLFLTQVEAFNHYQIRLAGITQAPGLTDVVVVPLFANAAVILLLITPLLTMQLICGERRQHTLPLLFSAPLSASEIILGKYLGILSLLMIIISLLTLMPLSLLVGATLDFGKLFSNLLGLSLLVAAFSAVGLYMSTLASHPTIAAISSFGLLLMLWMLNISRTIRQYDSQLFDYLSLLNHFQSMQTGLLTTADISYFLLFIATFIILSIRRLEHDRSHP
jgi:ABC-2 type transport system permease protein